MQRLEKGVKRVGKRKHRKSKGLGERSLNHPNETRRLEDETDNTERELIQVAKQTKNQEKMSWWRFINSRFLETITVSLAQLLLTIIFMVAIPADGNDWILSYCPVVAAISINVAGLLRNRWMIIVSTSAALILAIGGFMMVTNSTQYLITTSIPIILGHIYGGRLILDIILRCVNPEYDLSNSHDSLERIAQRLDGREYGFSRLHKRELEETVKKAGQQQENCHNLLGLLLQDLNIALSSTQNPENFVRSIRHRLDCIKEFFDEAGITETTTPGEFIRLLEDQENANSLIKLLKALEP